MCIVVHLSGSQKYQFWKKNHQNGISDSQEILQCEEDWSWTPFIKHIAFEDTGKKMKFSAMPSSWWHILSSDWGAINIYITVPCVSSPECMKKEIRKLISWLLLIWIPICRVIVNKHYNAFFFFFFKNNHDLNRPLCWS